jgi:hypothetical protein
MIKRTITRVAVASCILGLTVSAYAQDSVTNTVREQVQPRESAIEMVPDEEKSVRTRRAVDNMRGSLSKVLGYLEEAREQRDVLKLNCVNEKLTAIKGLLRVSEQAAVTMMEALATKDVSVAQHEYEKIMIAASKTGELSAESEVCIGELAVYSGQTSVTVEVNDEVVSTAITGSDNSGVAGTGSEGSAASSSDAQEGEASSLQEAVMDSPESAPSSSGSSSDSSDETPTETEETAVSSNPNEDRPPAASGS